jgi:hypothetical protein
MAVTTVFWVVRKDEQEILRKRRWDRQMMFSPGIWAFHNL